MKNQDPPQIVQTCLRTRERAIRPSISDPLIQIDTYVVHILRGINQAITSKIIISFYFPASTSEMFIWRKKNPDIIFSANEHAVSKDFFRLIRRKEMVFRSMDIAKSKSQQHEEEMKIFYASLTCNRRIS